MAHGEFADFGGGVFEGGLEDLPFGVAGEHGRGFRRRRGRQAFAIGSSCQVFQVQDIIAVLVTIGFQLALQQVQGIREKGAVLFLMSASGLLPEGAFIKFVRPPEDIEGFSETEDADHSDFLDGTGNIAA